MKKTRKSSAGSVGSPAAPSLAGKKSSKNRPASHATPSAVPDAGPGDRYPTSQLPELPADGEQELFQAAHDLDLWELNGKADRKTSGQKIRNHRDGLYRHIQHSLEKLPQLSIAWPHSLYIPAKANYRNYWILPAPEDHRYKLSWTPAPMPVGYGEASHDTGKLYCIYSASAPSTGTSGQRLPWGLSILPRPPSVLLIFAPKHIAPAITAGIR